MSVIQVVKLQAMQGKADELLPMLDAGRGVALASDGCEGFDVIRSQDEPENFMLIERWASEDQHQAHFQKNIIESGVVEKVSSLLQVPMEYGYYEIC